MLRVPFGDVLETLVRALGRMGFDERRAALCARLFAETTRDGVYTHGLNRFPRFARMIRNGDIDPRGEAEPVAARGVLERWNGNRGPGNLNAWRSMERAIEIARRNGVGCVALANTTHWMRGGTYGWQAADAGAVGLCWTNTLPNLPPWGAADARLGNNPLVIAVPRPGGHVVLDMAMSQFSFGALAAYRERGEELPVAGGFDTEGRLTRDPAAIEQSGRPLPIGCWKGSGLALMLDMMAALLAGGRATHQIPADPMKEVGVSQVFVAFDPAAFGAPPDLEQLAGGIIASLDGAGTGVRYPGERVLRIRAENTALGLPVEPVLWRELSAL